MPHSIVVESGASILFGSLPHGKNKGLTPYTIGKTVVA